MSVSGRMLLHQRGKTTRYSPAATSRSSFTLPGSGSPSLPCIAYACAGRLASSSAIFRQRPAAYSRMARLDSATHTLVSRSHSSARLRYSSAIDVERPLLTGRWERSLCAAQCVSRFCPIADTRPFRVSGQQDLGCVPATTFTRSGCVACLFELCRTPVWEENEAPRQAPRCAWTVRAASPWRRRSRWRRQSRRAQARAHRTLTIWDDLFRRPRAARFAA